MAVKNTETSISPEVLAELKAQLKAELEAEAKVKAKVDNGPEVKTTEWLEELVPVRLFKDGKEYTDDVYVGINGQNWLIKRGVEVMVPRKVALVLEESQMQDLAANEYATSKQEEYNSQTIKFNI